MNGCKNVKEQRRHSTIKPNNVIHACRPHRHFKWMSQCPRGAFYDGGVEHGTTAAWSTYAELHNFPGGIEFCVEIEMERQGSTGCAVAHSGSLRPLLSLNLPMKLVRFAPRHMAVSAFFSPAADPNSDQQVELNIRTERDQKGVVAHGVRRLTVAWCSRCDRVFLIVFLFFVRPTRDSRHLSHS
jgi:hypothetical protein